MPKIESLTKKQRIFIKELIKTLSPTEAAFRAYDCKDRLSARVIASQNLTKLNISMVELLDRMGLGLEEDVEHLKRLRNAKKTQACDIYIKDKNGKFIANKNSNDFIEVEDNATQFKALELTFKVKKLLKDVELNIDQSEHQHLTIVRTEKKDEKLESLAQARRSDFLKD